MPRKKKPCPDCGKLIQGQAKYCKSCGHIGARHNLWKGGRYIDNGGYVYIYMPNHPNSNSKHYIYEHVSVMEKRIGRFLIDKEEIHHINEIKTDNRIENLFLCKNHSEHLKQFHKIKPIIHTLETKQNLSKKLSQELDFVTKEWLENEYKLKSARTISKEIHKSYGWVRKRLIRFSIDMSWRRR